MRYRNLTFFLLSVLFAIYLARLEVFHSFLLNLGELGFIGAFFAGILWVSTFTVATGVVIILVLAEQLSAVELGLVAGLGAVVGDFAIFRFIKDNLVADVKPLYKKLGGSHLTKVLRSKYFSWTLPVIGAVIIASPFPDEIGVSLLGLSKMPTYQFLFVSFLLNAAGIFLLVSASTVIKPYPVLFE